jgi:His-Xaa-Ser system radical SAM maturase HxsC
MIPLFYRAQADAPSPYVARLAASATVPSDAVLVEADGTGTTYAGPNGLLFIEDSAPAELLGDVVLVTPDSNRIERLLRVSSNHNTLLVTERCDQLCIMCSQPPKKHHHDRFAHFTEACLLARPGAVIGISGGEPTLYKEELLALLEGVLGERPDLEFHVLTNGQHFTAADIERLRRPLYRKVCWGIPLYAADRGLHDDIVGKPGAFERLHESMAALLLGGARIELRTVLLTRNVAQLRAIARHVAGRLQFIESWSIMQLENIGFARGRWHDLFHDHSSDFGPVALALDHALLHGLDARLFNFPLCSVPPSYRTLAEPSISDWKRKFAPACAGCSARATCSGFFEWHPDPQAQAMARPQ